MKKEVEVFGVTYDRYVLLQLHKIMTAELGLKRVLEMPSHGAKAAGSLYSIGFGLAGCRVVLANPEMEMMYGWEELGIQEQVETCKDIDVYQSGFADGEFDLAWNFVTWTELEDPAALSSGIKAHRRPLCASGNLQQFPAGLSLASLFTQNQRFSLDPRTGQIQSYDYSPKNVSRCGPEGR